MSAQLVLRGGIDLLNHRRIIGWAWDPGAPHVPVPILVVIERRVLGRVLADLYREDLAAQGFGTGRCGFALDLPAELLSLRQGYEISVRREGDGVHLPGSPYVLDPLIRVVREE
ncbi:hypothetical protein MKK65_08035 [Methylobacterium sp. J-001]|nr:hypothetical protein [Methylobacterium sp. J-001]